MNEQRDLTLPRTWTEGAATYHEVRGKRSTFWVDCQECGKRQPAGIEEVTAYGGSEVVIIERLSSRWAKPQIGRCSVCYAPGPLAEIAICPSGLITTSQCDRRCLEAEGDDCHCQCLGRCHAAGVCMCKVTP